MTLIQIPATERETHKHVCALFDLTARFYTHESNSELLTMEVDSDSPVILYHLSKVVNIRIQMMEALKTSSFNKELKF